MDDRIDSRQRLSSNFLEVISPVKSVKRVVGINPTIMNLPTTDVLGLDGYVPEFDLLL